MAAQQSQNDHELPFSQFRAKVTALEEGVTAPEEASIRQQSTIEALRIEKEQAEKACHAKSAELLKSHEYSAREIKSLQYRIDNYERIVKQLHDRLSDHDKGDGLHHPNHNAHHREIAIRAQPEHPARHIDKDTDLQLELEIAQARIVTIEERLSISKKEVVVVNQRYVRLKLKMAPILAVANKDEDGDFFEAVIEDIDHIRRAHDEEDSQLIEEDA